jgi:hypothetical protein
MEKAKERLNSKPEPAQNVPTAVEAQYEGEGFGVVDNKDLESQGVPINRKQFTNQNKITKLVLPLMLME